MKFYKIFEGIQKFTNFYDKNKKSLTGGSGKILIITPCSSKKDDEVKKDQEVAASKLYQGKGIELMNEVIENNKSVDWYILSSGYGLINATSKIKPYNLTVNELGANDIEKLNEKFQVDEKFNKLIKGYKVCFLTLTDKYKDLLGLEQIAEKDDLKNCKIYTIESKEEDFGNDNIVTIPVSISKIQKNLKSKHDIGLQRGSLNYREHLLNIFFKKNSPSEITSSPDSFKRFVLNMSK